MQDIRAADSDRDRVIDILARAAGEGRLTFEELEERAARAQGAKMLSELAPLTSDLGVDIAAAPNAGEWTTPPSRRVVDVRSRTRQSAAVWVGAVLALVLLLAYGLVALLQADHREVTAVVASGEMHVSDTPAEPLTQPTLSAGDGGVPWTVKPIAAAGTSFVNAVSSPISANGYVAYSLDQRFRSVAASLVAITDEATSDPVVGFDVFVDGVRLLHRDVRAGAVVPVTVPTVRASELRVEVSVPAGYHVVAVLGDARGVPVTGSSHLEPRAPIVVDDTGG